MSDPDPVAPAVPPELPTPQVSGALRRMGARLGREQARVRVRDAEIDRLRCCLSHIATAVGLPEDAGVDEVCAAVSPLRYPGLLLGQRSVLQHQNEQLRAEVTRLRAELADTRPCDNHLSGEFGGPDHWCTKPLGHRGWHQEGDGVKWRSGETPASEAGPAEPDELIERCAAELCRMYIAELLILPAGLPGVQYHEITEDGRDVYRRIVRAVLAVHRNHEEKPDG